MPPDEGGRPGDDTPGTSPNHNPDDQDATNRSNQPYSYPVSAPEPQPLDPHMTAEHADGELFALTMEGHRVDVGRAMDRCADAVGDLFMLRPEALTGIEAITVFHAVARAAETMAIVAREGVASSHHAHLGEDDE